MNQGKYVFAQIVDFFTQYELDTCIQKYHGDKKVRKLSCRDQFLAMMFGQLANIKSFRGIVICLNAHARCLYHMGFRSSNLVLTTLTRANENRDWRIYRDMSQILIDKTRKLYANDNDFEIELEGTPYVIDSSIIELCLSTFKWANYYQGMAGVKIHTQMDLKGNIPTCFLITEAIVRDWDFLDLMEFEKGAYYIMDRGYYDFSRLYRIHLQSAYFVIRAKKNISLKRIYSKKVNKLTGIRCDQIVVLKDRASRKRYSEQFRRIKYYDQESNKYYVFLTNNMKLDAKIIADLHKYRWQIELFFKWIKQHLHIEVFWGCSPNAVKTQICIAMCTFLLVALIKKKTNSSRSLYEILQILSVSLFDKTSLHTLLTTFEQQNFNEQLQFQACLFDF
jgi:hypothetical protein